MLKDDMIQNNENKNKTLTTGWRVNTFSIKLHSQKVPARNELFNLYLAKLKKEGKQSPLQ